MIRILVVDDSVTVRQRLIEILERQPDFEVVGQAGDGRHAIQLIAALRPDVVTLDLALPELNGLAVTEHVMAYNPTPILIVSASFNRGELFDTYQALASGAVDVLDKPRVDDDAWDQRFLAAVRMVAKIKVITHPRGRLGLLGMRTPPATSPPPMSAARCDVVALGASTGGPAALVDVIGVLPAGFPIPILVVLHIDAPFAGSFAEWLGDRTARTVAIAGDGDSLDAPPARVLMAPPRRHLVVEGHRLRLTSDPPRHSCQPSIDTLFDSLAAGYGASTCACLLTGMGRDGASGLLAIRQAGGLTIAQDELTSIVYGMPREAALCGGAERILPIDEIGPAIAQLARDPHR